MQALLQGWPGAERRIALQQGAPNPSWTHPLWLPSLWRSGLTSFLFGTGSRPRRQAWGGKRALSLNWRGCMWSRPRGITEAVAAIRQSSLWNTFRGRVVPGLTDGTNRWIVRDRSGVIHARIWAESKIVPRKTARCLGNSWLLCGLMINPRHSKWLSNSSLWAASSRSDLARTR